ncbi:hypothetical protein FM111_00025 [Brevundimonas diminuta 3F5N]|uniref:Uncharacterized protein n=1 Tax=Brevundimonas diminuta 3F5N TaxID=1255603 RepID=A0A1R4EP96_BREDI|nr:hypothetical protein FM111_00025 [Brevundimonas diminuta 3F5N]
MHGGARPESASMGVPETVLISFMVSPEKMRDRPAARRQPGQARNACDPSCIRGTVLRRPRIKGWINVQDRRRRPVCGWAHVMHGA